MRWPVVACLVCLALPGICAADVYKCVENGRTIYAERPCAANAQKLAPGPAITDEQRAASIESARRQRDVSQTIDALNAIEAARRQRLADRQAVTESAKQKRCAALLRTAKDAKDESNKWRYHQGLIDDARRRQKEAEDAHFSECYGSN